MLFIVLPAYNEEEALPFLLEDIHTNCVSIPHRIILVNDASTDRTQEIVEAYAKKFNNINIIRHEANQGLGGALASGFKFVLQGQDSLWDEGRPARRGEGQIERHQDVLITLDADNTHPADRIPLLLDKIRDGADLVIASRYVTGGGQYGLSIRRRILSWGAGKAMRLFFSIPGVKDYSCGYRAYRLEVLKHCSEYYGEDLMESKNFSAMVELLLKVSTFCTGIAEIPLILHYEQKRGKSKMKIWATIRGYLELIYQYKIRARRNMEWVED